MNAEKIKELYTLTFHHLNAGYHNIMIVTKSFGTVTMFSYSIKSKLHSHRIWKH